MVVINVSAIKRVRALCNIDLASVVTLDGAKKPRFELLEQLSGDPVLLVDVLYAICKNEADKLGVGDIEFGESMSGDAINEATEAFLGELIDFFPEAKRKVLQKIHSAAQRFDLKSKEHLQKILNDPELDNRIEQALTLSTNS